MRVEANGLEPAREYFYRFRVGREVSQVGRTKTAPPAAAAVDRLRFAVCGCSHLETGYFTAYRRIAAEQFDFVFHTGDYIYEGRDDGGRNPAVVRQHQGDEIYTLVDYRNRYAQYRLDPDLRAAHASAPFIVTWDDHEVDNDYAGDRDENDTPPEVFLLRRAAAYQAFFEMMPLRAATHSERSAHAPVSPAPVRSSARSERARHAAVPIQAGVRRDERRRDAPRRSIRRARFSGRRRSSGCSNSWPARRRHGPCSGSRFRRSRATTSTPIRTGATRWTNGTATSRRGSASTRDCKETRAPNPIVLSGDVHLHYGADLKLDFEDPRSDTVGVEFTNSSITSGGDGAEVNATWERVRGDNPHIKYHSARRGYIACTATPQTMRADFKVLDRVTVADAPERTGGSLVVEAGRPGASVG